MSQEANFEFFFLILHLISGKVTKFLVEKLSTSEVISQKPHGGGKHPPSAFRVKHSQLVKGKGFFWTGSGIPLPANLTQKWSTECEADDLSCEAVRENFSASFNKTVY